MLRLKLLFYSSITGVLRTSSNYYSSYSTSCNNSSGVSTRERCSILKHSPRRVIVYVPGSDQKKILKATNLDCDTIALDLEDSVALNSKSSARHLVCSALMNMQFGRSERCVRINSNESGLQHDDLQSLVSSISRLDGLVLPKVENSHQIQVVNQFLNQHDPENRIKLLVSIESALGLLNLKEICSSPRVDALLFASEDYCANVGATRTKKCEELLFARSTIVTYASAFKLQPLDMVCIDYKDQEQLRLECLQATNLGFTGKQAIHPNQIPIIYECFRPPLERIEFAKKVLREYNLHEKAGKGAFEVDGKVIDMPMVLQARNILYKANIQVDDL